MLTLFAAPLDLFLKRSIHHFSKFLEEGVVIPVLSVFAPADFTDDLARPDGLQGHVDDFEAGAAGIWHGICG